MAQQGGRRPVKYRQIADDLRARIERGEWLVDAQMPTLPELSAEYDAAQGTIARALGALHDLGIAETIQGMGTFVRTPPPERTGYDALRDQVAGLQQEVAALRERVAALNGQDELAMRVGRIEANLVALYGQLGREYPRGGSRERAKAAAGGGGQ
jgi:DNA-binding GntR family transcriptional regulator